MKSLPSAFSRSVKCSESGVHPIPHDQSERPSSSLSCQGSPHFILCRLAMCCLYLFDFSIRTLENVKSDLPSAISYLKHLPDWALFQRFEFTPNLKQTSRRFAGANLIQWHGMFFVLLFFTLFCSVMFESVPICEQGRGWWRRLVLYTDWIYLPFSQEWYEFKVILY